MAGRKKKASRSSTPRKPTNGRRRIIPLIISALKSRQAIIAIAVTTISGVITWLTRKEPTPATSTTVNATGQTAVVSFGQSGGVTAGTYNHTEVHNSDPDADRTALLSPGTNGPTQPPPWMQPEWVYFETGTTGFVVQEFPQVIVKQLDEPLMTIGKDGTNLWLSARFFNSSNKVLGEIVRNKVIRSEQTTFRFEKTDHRVIVFDDELRPVIDVEFLNPWRVRLYGSFYGRRGVKIDIDKDASQFGDRGISNITLVPAQKSPTIIQIDR